MYSMVLMMAMSTSPETAACHPKGCSGCTGVVVDAGCTGGAGCSGGHGLFGGCHGGGLFGGCFRKHGCNGGGCTGVVVDAGCSGGCVGTPVPVEPAPAPPVEKKDMPKDKKGGVTRVVPKVPAYITVNVPADASITIDGAATTSTSAVRVFATPSLTRGTVQYYTFVAEVVRDGKTFTATEKVAVEAGAKTVITLSPNVGPAVASK